MSEAKVIKQTTTNHIITGDQVKEADTLTVAGKPLLIVKGGSSQKLVERVLKEASTRLDRSGHPFTFSRSLRALCHRDPFNLSVKISATDLENYYLNDWYQYCEAVHEHPPQLYGQPKLINCPPQSYLRLLDKLPSYTAALLGQSRFLTMELVQLFTVTE
jgi:hypothetical protein